MEIHEYFPFLDAIRRTGKVNMYASGQYLRDHYGLSRVEAREVVLCYLNQDKLKQELLES